MSERTAEWKLWRVLIIAFAIGAVVGGALLVPRFSAGWEKVPWPLQWLLVPGFLLLAPAWVLTGGVHGDYANGLFQLVPWANGLAYALLTLTIRWIWVRRRQQRTESGS